MTELWTEREDVFLISYGPVVGYNYVAEHDLGKREHGAGLRRILWLSVNRPELVERINREEQAANAALDVAVWAQPMSNIVPLRLSAAQSSPYQAMEDARRKFLHSLNQWLQENPDQNLVRDEVQSLHGAVLGLVQLYGGTDGK